MATRKVYRAHLGFYDTVVAAHSRQSALAAWGSTQDLFRLGLAKPTDDPAAVKAALAKPGIVLKRLAGSTVAFSEHPPLPDIGAKTDKTRAKPATRKPRAQARAAHARGRT